MTPPAPPRLMLAPPIPREEPPEDLPPPVVAPDPDRLDTVIKDQRATTLRLARLARRQRRGHQILRGVSRGVRRIERGQWLLAADVSRALAPVQRRATAAAVSPVVAGVLYLLARLFGGE